MPKPTDKTAIVTHFSMAQPQTNIDGNTKPLKRPGAHLGKKEITRDVLKRILNHVKRI